MNGFRPPKMAGPTGRAQGQLMRLCTGDFRRLESLRLSNLLKYTYLQRQRSCTGRFEPGAVHGTTGARNFELSLPGHHIGLKKQDAVKRYCDRCEGIEFLFG